MKNSTTKAIFVAAGVLMSSPLGVDGRGRGRGRGRGDRGRGRGRGIRDGALNLSPGQEGQSRRRLTASPNAGGRGGGRGGRGGGRGRGRGRS